MTFVHRSYILILALFYKIPTIAPTDLCGETVFRNQKGTIHLKKNSFNESVDCQWVILSSPNAIITLRIAGMAHTADDLNLSVMHNPVKVLNISKAFSIRSTFIPINLKSNSSLDFWLEFSSRNNTECSYSDFQCIDRTNCYNSSDIRKNFFICNDHSDQLGVAPCNITSSKCNNETELCFDYTRRCDNVLNCPRGEDEINCAVSCPGQIKCPGETQDKCITQDQICDQILDCSNGYDENACNGNNSKTMLIIGVFALCSVCSFLFICLIFRWLITRRDFNRFMDNLPQFPLAPFQGPGDDGDDSIENSNILESDFHQTGDIYQSYISSKRRTVSKSIQVGSAKYNHLELDGDNEIVVLASLNVPSESCIGLQISKESVTSLRSRGSAKIAVQNGDTVNEVSMSNPNNKIDYLPLINADICYRKNNRVLSARLYPTQPFKSLSPPRTSKSDNTIIEVVDSNIWSEAYKGPTSTHGLSDGSSNWTDIEPSLSNTKLIRVKPAKNKSDHYKRNYKRKVTRHF